jgi:A/G-specific adenine glycosylase
MLMPAIRSVAKVPKNPAPLPTSAAPFRRALLAWYDANRRDLPWRRTSDPYAIWLSEIMLQQTRVAAVLDHYRIFLERFPNISSLAAASEDSVLAAWSGLGYYRRARMLHKCAAEVVDQHSGNFPHTAEALLALPGIGRYTAAAVASIAFQQPVAVVDGNVERILDRLTGRTLLPTQCWRHAQQLLAPSRPGDFNQALMELGATVCLPRQPRCLICPVRKYCTTRGELPGSRPAALRRSRDIWVSLLCRNGRKPPLSCPACGSCRIGLTFRIPRLAAPSGARSVIRSL